MVYFVRLTCLFLYSAQGLDCPNAVGTDTMVGHSHALPKHTVEFTWSSEGESIEGIHFRYHLNITLSNVYVTCIISQDVLFKY